MDMTDGEEVGGWMLSARESVWVDFRVADDMLDGPGSDVGEARDDADADRRPSVKSADRFEREDTSTSSAEGVFSPIFRFLLVGDPLSSALDPMASLPINRPIRALVRCPSCSLLLYLGSSSGSSSPSSLSVLLPSPFLCARSPGRSSLAGLPRTVLEAFVDMVTLEEDPAVLRLYTFAEERRDALDPNSGPVGDDPVGLDDCMAGWCGDGESW